MKIQDEILIDEKNQMLIRDLVRTINELQGRLQLIMQTIINYSKAEGNFKLSEIDILFEKPKDRENIKSRNGKFSKIY